MSGMRNWWKRAVMAGAAGLAACAAMAAKTETAAAGKPAMWKLADEDTTIYLFGTIHLLPKGVDWRTPLLDKAIADSQGLVLETVIGSDPMTAAGTMMKLGIRSGLPPLAERVPAEKREALAQLIKASGVPATALDQMETWAASLTLLAIQLKTMGFDSDNGVEKMLSASYSGSKKPVTGLETVEQQFGFFDGLSEEAQRQLLASTVDSPQEAKAQFEAMMNAWRTGDADAIAKTFDTEFGASPELRDVLMKRRNAAWAEWLDKRMDQPGTVLVAVGAGHLVGKESVQAMLAAKGLKTTRVQ